MSSLLSTEDYNSKFRLKYLSHKIDSCIIRLIISSKRPKLVNHRTRLQGPWGLLILCCQSLRNPFASWKSSLTDNISKKSRCLKTTTPVKSFRNLEIISIWVKEQDRDCSSRSKNKYKWTRMKMQIDDLSLIFEFAYQRRNYYYFLLKLPT